MYWRVSIHTRLTPEEAEAALGRLVGRERARSDPGPPDPRPFTGRVSMGTFEFRRIVIGRNDFRPIISGRIDASQGGAVVRATLRTTVLVAIVETLWIAAAIILAVTRIPPALADGNVRDLVLVSLFLALPAALVGTGYVPEVRMTTRLMRQALQA